MVTIGDRITIKNAGLVGTVEDFYFGTGYRRNLVVGVYVQTEAGRVPVRLKRGTEALVDGEVRTVIV